MKSQPLLVAVLLSIFGIHLVAQDEKKLLHESWSNVDGVDVQSFKESDHYPLEASIVTEKEGLSMAAEQGDHYAKRVRGLLEAPVSGYYKFWVSGDDHVQLMLSTDDRKWSKQLVCETSRWTTPKNWGFRPEQESEYIYLEGGTSYFVELFLKENAGRDHADVAWSYSEHLLENLSLADGVTASQSTTDYGGLASRAIDGNTNGVWGGGSVTHTAPSDVNSWWQVDLTNERSIERVVLWNRNVIQARLSNYKISILDAAGNVVVSQDFHTDGAGYTRNSEVWQLSQPVSGRFVRVDRLGKTTLYNDNIICLAEVQVFGRQTAGGIVQEREVIGADHLTKFTVDPDDQDNDDLRDSWEQIHGFDLTQGETGDRSLYADPDRDGLSNYGEMLNDWDPLTGDSFAGLLSLERWEGISAYTIPDLYQHDRFFEQEPLELIASNVYESLSQNTGVRIRGYLTAPDTGYYRFWVSSSIASELWLSTDDTKYRKQLLAKLGADIGTGHSISTSETNLWDKFATQMSEEVYLEAGQRYFLEVLYQQGHNRTGHLRFAWARPDQERELIPLEYLSSYAHEPEDNDDDSLPDQWEWDHGLSVSDNGLVDRLRQGERGDFDGDGLSNRLEYVHGTNPANTDSDGDGVTDGEEVFTYGSDPITSDAPSEVTVNQISLSDYTSADSDWTLTSNGLISDSFRGTIDWNFTVPADGYWILKVDTKLLGRLYLNETLPVSVAINGDTMGKRTLQFSQSYQSSLRILTSYLPAGSHSLSLKIDNLFARRSLAIQSITVLQPVGGDFDGDSFPDWISNQLRDRNALKPYANASITSPAFLEGVARFPTRVSINGEPTNLGAGDHHWYGNFSLDPDSATSFEVGFEQGIAESGVISWQPTNVFTTDVVTIRKGDSLKLVAHPASGATGQNVRLSDSQSVAVNLTQRSGVSASQSTTAYGGSASRAIDNDTRSNWGTKTLTHTANQAGSWWEVDLGSESAIGSIKLWNRNIGQNRLSNYKISVLDANRGVVVSQSFHTSGTHVGNSESWSLPDAAVGRYVRIDKLGKGAGNTHFLTLSEVQVWQAQYDQIADADYSIKPFPEAGSYRVIAEHSNGQQAELQVEVKQAEFSQAKDVLTNFVGVLSFPKNLVDADLHFEGGDGISLLPAPAPDASQFYLKVGVYTSASTRLLARLFDGGPILNNQVVNQINLSDAFQNDLTSSYLSSEFPGFQVLSTPLVVTDLPDGGSVVVTVFRSGVTFPDGTKKKTFYASDFKDSVMTLEFLFPESMSGGYCHYIDVYDRNGVFLGRR